MRSKGFAALLFVSIIGLSAVAVILINLAIGMQIPFHVEFLVGFGGGLVLFIVWHATQTRGVAWGAGMMVFTYLATFIAEALGVNFGLIFGSYHYTDFLGTKLLGVPLLVSLTWGPITYASYYVVDALFPSAAWRTARFGKRALMSLLPALLAGFATTAWDLVIDVIAVQGGWWVWHGGGAYFPHAAGGIPISNFIGWLGLSTFVQWVYRVVFDRGLSGESLSDFQCWGPWVVYLSLFLTSLGVAITTLQDWEVTLIGLMSMGPFVVVTLIVWAKDEWKRGLEEEGR
ncbi:MAG: carotenoid biosynthesis protein [Anaerolineaceae bacterium]|nr:carotenoid biosynthesis protein [Anaerolineaceae bacterium]